MTRNTPSNLLRGWNHGIGGPGHDGMADEMTRLATYFAAGTAAAGNQVVKLTT
jgi:hypothetical protein